MKLKIHFETPPAEPVRIEFDSAAGKAPTAGYAIIVDPNANTATAYVRNEIDPIRLDGLSPTDLPTPDASGWAVQRMTVNRSFGVVPDSGSGVGALTDRSPFSLICSPLVQLPVESPLGLAETRYQPLIFASHFSRR